MNRDVAEKLREVADLLALQDASPYRVLAYRRAAETIDALDEDLTALLDRDGLDGLIALPHIDRAIGSAVQELVRTGRLPLLDRLRGTLDPEKLFRTLPGIGPKHARLIHELLHLETLEDLEAAAWDGRLLSLPGMGPRRVQAIRASVQTLLGRVRARPSPDEEAPVELILDVDREYRERAARDELRKIAPRRLNPEGERWLPILHTQRGAWHFSALYSNTPRAHQLGRTHDWVIVYFTDGDHRERQRTVVTETHGPLEGRRVVRGREAECVRLASEAGAAP